MLIEDESRDYDFHHYEKLGNLTWKRDVVPSMPPTPPGLGFGRALGFEEAKSRSRPPSDFTIPGKPILQRTRLRECKH